MTRLLLAGALVASLAVPVGGFALVAAADSNRPSSGAPSTSIGEMEKDEMVDLYNELVGVDKLATPGSKGHAQETRRIAQEASAWAAAHGSDPVWHEFARATSEVARLMSRAIAGGNVPEAEYDRAVARLNAAADALPPERQALD